MPRKLGEALARRAELQARLGEVRDRLRLAALTQEGDAPAEEPAPLLEELEHIGSELEALIADINHTNAVTRLSSGRTLTQALARRDVLGGARAAPRGFNSHIAQIRPATSHRHRAPRQSTTTALDLRRSEGG